MANVEGNTTRWRYRRSVREHVREPLRRACERLEREQAELRAEQAAFERFEETVARITPTESTNGPLVMSDDREPEKRAEAREAYRETVMAVDHYERVYAEPLLVNVAGELSEDIAQGLRDDAGIPFTEHFRRMIRVAAREAAERRAKFNDRVEDERSSIATAQETLREVTDALEGSGLPASRRRSFDERLDDLLAERQRRIQSRAAYRQDGHDLCEYIYADEEWTYPVLTAVARLRNSVD